MHLNPSFSALAKFNLAAKGVVLQVAPDSDIAPDNVLCKDLIARADLDQSIALEIGRGLGKVLKCICSGM